MSFSKTSGLKSSVKAANRFSWQGLFDKRLRSSSLRLSFADVEIKSSVVKTDFPNFTPFNKIVERQTPKTF